MLSSTSFVHVSPKNEYRFWETSKGFLARASYRMKAIRPGNLKWSWRISMRSMVHLPQCSRECSSNCFKKYNKILYNFLLLQCSKEGLARAKLLLSVLKGIRYRHDNVDRNMMNGFGLMEYSMCSRYKHNRIHAGFTAIIKPNRYRQLTN